jgi:hypothetical protein
VIEQNELETELQSYITAIRQDNGDWLTFRDFVETNIGRISEQANLRWLTSICDTYADKGCAVERRNAMLISVLVKMEKIAQTYAHWRLEYPGELGAPAEDKHRKVRLPEGLSSFNLDIGDAPNTMFGRMADMLSESPVLSAILDAVKLRLAKSDSILGNLNRRHGHVFENDYSWIVADEYRQYRDSGRIPRHRWERWLQDG